jgi:hypothetical protein
METDIERFDREAAEEAKFDAALQEARAVDPEVKPTEILPTDEEIIARETAQVIEVLDFMGVPHGPVKCAYKPAADGGYGEFSWSIRPDDKPETEILSKYNPGWSQTTIRMGTIMTVVCARHGWGWLILMALEASKFAYPEMNRNHPLELFLRREIAEAKSKAWGRGKIYDQLVEGMKIKLNIEEADFGNNRERRRHRKGAVPKLVAKVGVE